MTLAAENLGGPDPPAFLSCIEFTAFSLAEFHAAPQYTLMDEHRKSQRHRTFKGGSISFDLGIVDCVVRNISDTGALLELKSHAGIPDKFTLIIKPEYLKRSCEVVWRSARNIGVKFI